jgi:uncharacterized membrane protein YphA (DoxX/SURF4 family)
MNWITKIVDWGNANRPGFLDYLRVLLGGFITYKGAQFMENFHELELTTAGLNLDFLGIVLAHYVVFAHLLGGPLLALGLFTRLMCLIQLPILLGAVVVTTPQGFALAGGHHEFEFALGTLVGLLVYMVFGAGKFSVDHRRRIDDAEHAHAH